MTPDMSMNEAAQWIFLAIIWWRICKNEKSLRSILNFFHKVELRNKEKAKEDEACG